MPRLSKQCSLIIIGTVWKIFASAGLHVHTVELVLIQGSNINKPYFITHIKNYLTKLSTLYIFQSSNPLQNITSTVQFQQDTLQFCKLESERDELFINYSHAAAKRFFINQIANTALHAGNRREYLNPHHSLIPSTILWTNRF